MYDEYIHLNWDCGYIVLMQPNLLGYHQEEIGAGLLRHPLRVHTAELRVMGDVWLASGGIPDVGSDH